MKFDRNSFIMFGLNQPKNKKNEMPTKHIAYGG